MCGIVGVINQGDKETLWKMIDVQTHRGPNDKGMWEQRYPDGTYIGLGNSRLSIIDLSPAGHMPMCNEDETIWITHNGEIYNFPELRKELSNKGHIFRSNTDTETILHLYEEEGHECVKRLDGMFAFAIWDSREQSLFLARDHFGVKLLYYIHSREQLAFASEIKALLLLEDVPREVDLEALHQYLTFLWVPDPKTMFRDIYKLPAGCYALFQQDKLQIVQYWDLTFPPADYQYDKPLSELIEQVRELFQRSVQAQMISDVPIGAFLSSGMDSSSIVAMMSRASNEPINTYTITFPPKYRRGEATLDDPRIASRLAGELGCQHREMVVDPDVAELLPKIIWHLDEPIAASIALTTYLVCREAKPTATVLLSGIGGDEVFGGYRKYIGHFLAQRYQRLPEWLRRRVIEPFALGLPSLRGTPLKDYVRLAKKMATSGSLPPRERFIMDGTYFTDRQKAELYSDYLKEETRDFEAWKEHEYRFERVENADFLNQMLYLDTKIFMISLNLTLTDKMSMASSVEVRVPFLDKALAEFVAWEVPPHLKLNGHTTKYILREAMKDILPPCVLRARKAAFGAPIDYWLANELRPMVDELLSERQIRRRGYFDPAFVRRMIREHRSGRHDWSLQVWQFLTLELWLQTFIDGSNPSEL